MSLWCIENTDEAGEGMFVVDAANEQAARKAHAKKNPQAKVTRCERVRWVDFALVTGELGESYYFERQRKAKE